MKFIRTFLLGVLAVLAPFAHAQPFVTPSITYFSQEQVDLAFQSNFGFGVYSDVTGDSFEFRPYVRILGERSVIPQTKLFRPLQNATRGEALEMLVRALDAANPNWKLSQSARPVSTWFIDVQKGSKYYSFVYTGAIYGFISQGLKFRPNDPISRQEFAKIAYYAMIALFPGNANKTESGFAFSDASTFDRTISPFIYSLHANKIISSYSDNTFRPTDNITRSQVAKFVARTAFPGDAGLEFATGVELKADKEFATVFAATLLDNVLKGIPLSDEYRSAEEHAKRGVKIAMLPVIAYLRKEFDKELYEELLKSLVGEVGGLPGKVLVELKLANGFWSTIKKTVTGNPAGLAMIVVDLTLDSVATTVQETLERRGEAVRGAAAWSSIKLIQMAVDAQVAYATGGPAAAVVAELGVTVDILWEDAMLVGEIWDVSSVPTFFRGARADLCRNPHLNLLRVV